MRAQGPTCEPDQSPHSRARPFGAPAVGPTDDRSATSIRARAAGGGWLPCSASGRSCGSRRRSLMRPPGGQGQDYRVFSESDFIAGAEDADVFTRAPNADRGPRLGQIAGPAMIAAVLAAIV